VLRIGDNYLESALKFPIGEECAEIGLLPELKEATVLVVNGLLEF
jgi:hypothetical protein